MRPTLLLTAATTLACTLTLLSRPAQAQPQAPSVAESLMALNATATPAFPAPVTPPTTVAAAPAPATDAALVPAIAAAPADAGATVQLTGQVLSPAGRLPGAVVSVAGTKLKTVTNADGEFSLTVPASGQPVSLITSYAGFVDETVALTPDAAPLTLKLTTPQVIKVARRQQLKSYLKTARKQVKRSQRVARRR